MNNKMWGPTWETLKKKRASFCGWKPKWRPAEEIGAWSMLKFLIGSLDFRTHEQYMITIYSCLAHDNLTLYAYYNLTFNMIGTTMAYYNLTFNVTGVTMAYYNLTFNVIDATMGGPSQIPLACLNKPRVCGNKAELLRWKPCRVWLSLACRGAGLGDSRLTSPREPSALLREVPMPLSFCRAPPH